MPAPSKEGIESIVSLYRDDDSATLASVAEAAGLRPETVRRYVEAAGVPVRDDAGASDEDLGIGMDMDSITQSAAFQDAVAEAVAKALAQRNIKPADTGQHEGPGSPEWLKFVEHMERLTESVNVQKPGYQKPLSPDELESRREGEKEFFALLRNVRLDIADHGKDKAVSLGLVPEYIVGEQGFYGSTASGEILFLPGQRIYLSAPPPEDFLPMNNSAAAIMRAQMQWLGEPTPAIEELVAQAMMRARGSESLSIVGDATPQHRDDATLIDAEAVNIGPKRTMGTSVPELTVTSHGPLSPGSTTGPKGPVFVG